MMDDRDLGYADNQLGNYVAALEDGDNLTRQEVKFVGGELGRIANQLEEQGQDKYQFESDAGDTYTLTLDDDMGEFRHYADEWFDEDSDMRFSKSAFLTTYHKERPRNEMGE